MSKKEFKAALYDRLASQGLVDHLKVCIFKNKILPITAHGYYIQSEFRAKILLQMDGQTKFEQRRFLSATSKENQFSTHHQWINLLIKDHLVKENMEFTLSVFLPESGQNNVQVYLLFKPTCFNLNGQYMDLKHLSRVVGLDLERVYIFHLNGSHTLTK